MQSSQPRPMMTVSSSNPLKPCNEYPEMDLAPWGNDYVPKQNPYEDYGPGKRYYFEKADTGRALFAGINKNAKSSLKLVCKYMELISIAYLLFGQFLIGKNF